MPLRTTREQRIEWRVAYAHACGRREIPDGIEADVEKLLKARKR